MIIGIRFSERLSLAVVKFAQLENSPMPCEPKLNEFTSKNEYQMNKVTKLWFSLVTFESISYEMSAKDLLC